MCIVYKRSFLHRNFKMPSKQTGRQIDISRCPYSLLNFCWMVNAKCSFLSTLFDLNCQNPLGLCNFVAFFFCFILFLCSSCCCEDQKIQLKLRKIHFWLKSNEFLFVVIGKKRNETTCKRIKKTTNLLLVD